MTAQPTPEEIASVRRDFPAVERTTYLISASLGPMHRDARDRVGDYLDLWERVAAPDPIWFDHIFPQAARVKDLLGRLTGAARDELALTLNVSQAQSAVASCIDFTGARNRVILSELDFPTQGHVWLAQRKRGAEIVFVRSDDGLTIAPERYLEAIDERTAIVCLHRVLYRSSALVDFEPVIAAARAAGALSLVDDYHGAGILPLDVYALDCDFYTAGVLKWLCGGPGLAFLYVRRALVEELSPAVAGWWSQREPFAFASERLDFHPTARRFELGTSQAPVLFVAEPGVRAVLDFGVERIRMHQAGLGDHVIATADELGLDVRSPRDAAMRGGVVYLGVGSRQRAREIVRALYARDVCIDARADGIRVAPHFFNTREDVDWLFELLAQLL